MAAGTDNQATNRTAVGQLNEGDAIGRELPLAHLLGDLKGVLGGAGRMCLITGEAGVGKTRLIREFLGRASAHDCFVLSGRAHDYDHGVAYASLRDQLSSAPLDELGPEAGAELERLGRALDAAVLGEPGAHGAALQPAYLLASRFLHGLAQTRPTVLVLDDAHQADDESLTVLSLAARHLQSVPLLLIFSARRDQWLPGSRFAGTIGRLVDGGLGRSIDLDPLDEEDTKALVASVLGVRPERQLTHHVYCQSRGNPLLAREALRRLLQSRSVKIEHGQGYLIDPPSAGAISGRAALLHRVFQQDRPGREVARIMSAFRRVLPEQLPALQAMTGLDREAMEQTLDALLGASIISAVEGKGWEFTHPLMAEVLYDDLGSFERRRIHGLIAESFGEERKREPAGLLDWTMHKAEAALPGGHRRDPSRRGHDQKHRTPVLGHLVCQSP